MWIGRCSGGVAAMSLPSSEMTPSLRESISALSPTPPPATDRNEEGSEHNFGAR